MLYSKRRKNLGGGRRKRSNRKSYMSKRTKRTTLTRIKQRGGSQPKDCPPFNGNICPPKEGLITINAVAAGDISSSIEKQHTYIYTTKNPRFMDSLLGKLRIKDKDTSYECCSAFKSVVDGSIEQKYIIKTKAKKDFIKFLLKYNVSLFDINNIPDKEEERNKLIADLEAKEKVMFLALLPEEQFAMILKLIDDKDERDNMISYLDKGESKQNQLGIYVEEYNEIVRMVGEVDPPLKSITTEPKQENLIELNNYLGETGLVKMLLTLDKPKQDNIFAYLNPSIIKYIRSYLVFATMLSKQPNLYLDKGESIEQLQLYLYLEYHYIETIVRDLVKLSPSPSFTTKTKIDEFKTYAKAFYQYLSKTELVKILLPLDKTTQNDILSGLDSEITKCIRLCLAFSIMISKQPKLGTEEGKEEESTEKQISELYLDYNAIEVKVLQISSATLFLQQSEFVKMLLRLNKTDQDTVDTILSYLNPDVSNIIREYLA
jgi:hypothetical protein